MLRKLIPAVWLALAAPAAWCHAVLLQMQPKAGAVVPGPKIPVLLRFNSRIDAKRSRLAVVQDGKEEQLAAFPQSAPDAIASEIKDAKPGPCRIRWQVLASDGHITRGEIVFEVK